MGECQCKPASQPDVDQTGGAQTRRATCRLPSVRTLSRWQRRSPELSAEFDALIGFTLRLKKQGRLIGDKIYRERAGDRLREKVRAASTKWRKQNAAAATEQAMKRIALRIKRMPPWADRDAIKRVYARAAWLTKANKVMMNVDHKIPLCGRTVSGLHVAANLRVIPAWQNLRKSNAFCESAFCSQ